MLNDTQIEVLFSAGRRSFYLLQCPEGIRSPACITQDSFPGVKRTSYETDHRSRSSVEVKTVMELYNNSLHAIIPLCLVKHKDVTAARQSHIGMTESNYKHFLLGENYFLVTGLNSFDV